MERITTIPEFVDACGGDSTLAKQLGLTYKAVAQWKARNHIASGYHLRLLAYAKKRGINVAPSVFGLSEEDVGELFHIAPNVSYVEYKAVA